MRYVQQCATPGRGWQPTPVFLPTLRAAVCNPGKGMAAHSSVLAYATCSSV